MDCQWVVRVGLLTHTDWGNPQLHWVLVSCNALLVHINIVNFHIFSMDTEPLTVPLHNSSTNLPLDKMAAILWTTFSNAFSWMKMCWFQLNSHYTPASTKLKGGILVSCCPSVCPSVCGQNRVRSVTSAILVESISYLHILSSNFRRCVAYKVLCKIPKFEFLANSSNL